jgi:hypothetical protein
VVCAKKKGVILANAALIVANVLFFVSWYDKRYDGKTRRLASIAGIIFVARPIGIIKENAAIIKSNNGLCMNVLPPYPNGSLKSNFPVRRLSIILV